LNRGLVPTRSSAARQLDAAECSWSVRVEDDMDTDEFDRSRLTRDIHQMPDDIRHALTSRGVMEAYRRRPPYQQNDYVGWITRSKLPATRSKRLAQMLDELERGGVYMHMTWHGER
jgi:hypothetical protein